MFIVHLDPLCESSKFFKAAFSSEFKEGIQKSMDLPEDDVDTADTFVDWLYTQEYHQLAPARPYSGAKTDELLEQAIQLLRFADKYDVPALMKHTLEEILFYAKEHDSILPAEEIVKYIYEQSTRGEGIRRLLADWYTYRVELKWFAEPNTQDWLLTIPGFSVDLMNSFAQHIEMRPGEDEDGLLDSKTSEHYMQTKEENSDST